MKRYYKKGNICPKCLGTGEYFVEDECYYTKCEYCNSTGWIDDIVDKVTGLRVIQPREHCTKLVKEVNLNE